MATTITKPIWQDTYYTTTANSVNYRIELDGGVIFTGKAVKYPGAEELRININKICRNYLSSDISTLLDTFPYTLTSVDNPLAMRTFKLYVNNVNVYDYRFYYDWGYGEEIFDDEIVSLPVNGHYADWMLKLRTSRDLDTENKVYTEGIVSANNALGYNTKVSCDDAKYALYYLNSFGGWDSFLIEGKVVKKDNYTSYQTDKAFDNNTIEFETNKYVNEIKRSYELNTGLLTDEQAKRLADNLFGSLKVYLDDYDEVFPVIITDTAVTYQTYENNGMKLCSYRINVTNSQSRIRK